jgi:hypothetical protein
MAQRRGVALQCLIQPALQKQRLAAQVMRRRGIGTLVHGSFEPGERLVDLPAPQIGAPARDQIVVPRHPWQNSLCVNAFRAGRARSEAGTPPQSLVLPG